MSEDLESQRRIGEHSKPASETIETIEPEPASETRTVREAIEAELDHDEIHGYSVNHRSGDTVYVVVVRTVDAFDVETAPDADFPVLDRRTVAVDMDTQNVTMTANGLWTPADAEVIEADIKLGARAVTDTTNGEAVGEPLTRSTVDDLDAELFLDALMHPESPTQDIEQMQDTPGIDDGRDWGYGGSPPPEIAETVARLEAAGADASEHLIRCWFGKKRPLDKPRERFEPEQIRGNYGIELRPWQAGLVAIDIDYPDELDEDATAALPATWSVSSPHGGDDRRHLLFWCEDKQAIADELGGAWSTSQPDWGELWVGNRFVVGPGSELSAYGCTAGNFEAGEPEACGRCMTPGRGTYDIVEDRPIATVEPETVIEHLCPDRHETAAAGDDEVVREILENHVICDSCGDTIHEDDALRSELDGETTHICAGGCD